MHFMTQRLFFNSRYCGNKIHSMYIALTDARTTAALNKTIFGLILTRIFYVENLARNNFTVKSNSSRQNCRDHIILNYKHFVFFFEI